MSAYSPPTRRIPSCSSDYPQCEAEAHTLFPLPSHQIKAQNLSFLKRYRQIFSFRVLKRQILLPFAQKQTKTLSVFAVALHPEGVDRNIVHTSLKSHFFVALHPEGVDRNPDTLKVESLADVALHPEGVDRNLNIAHGLEYDLVALHPEGVDRNLGCRPVAKAGEVALHPEGVDRNKCSHVACFGKTRRPPPGGRG